MNQQLLYCPYSIGKKIHDSLWKKFRIELNFDADIEDKYHSAVAA